MTEFGNVTVLKTDATDTRAGVQFPLLLPKDQVLAGMTTLSVKKLLVRDYLILLSCSVTVTQAAVNRETGGSNPPETAIVY